MNTHHRKKWLLAGAALLALGAGGAWGHGRVHFGFAFGPGFWDPWPFDYYPPRPIYYYDYPQIIIQQPTVYIERAPAPAPAAQQYWYYCAASRGYYPRVKTCPGGWLPVLPESP